MKKTVSVLLAVCVAAGVCASCGRAAVPEHTMEEVQPAVTQARTPEASTAEETTVEETTMEETTAAPLLMTPAKPFDPADRLEPTEADMERLTELLGWGDSFFNEDYDSETSPVLEYLWWFGAVDFGMRAYDLLRPDENYMERTESPYIGNDPRGYFDEGCYKKIRADVMEYYLENMFHNFTYTSAREGATMHSDAGKEYAYYYYEDGWYYFNCYHTDTDLYPMVREYQTQSNGHYLITVDLVCYGFEKDGPSDPLQTIFVDATLIEKDGRRLWTIYSSTVQDKSKHVGF